MGIRLTKNFDKPYSATTIKEFWSRWHISLSSWLKDYLYIPLGGNRVKLPRYYFNIMIVFLASGLWHGANYTFLIWGLLHGVYQVVGHATRGVRGRILSGLGKNENDSSVLIVRKIITFALVAFSWLIFRANSPSDLATLLTLPFTNGGILATLEYMNIGICEALIMAFAFALMLIFDRILSGTEYIEDGKTIIDKGGFIYIIWVIALVWILLIAHDMISTFIYFQF